MLVTSMIRRSVAISGWPRQHSASHRPNPPLMRLQHVNVAQIAEGGVIGDQPGETDLSGAVIQAEAQAVERDWRTVSLSMPSAHDERVRNA